MLQPLDGPSVQDIVGIDNITVVVIKVGALALEERKVVTLQADGKIKIYFGDGTTVPNAATVLAKGFRQPRDTLRSYEASTTQILYMISDTGATVNVTVAERS